MLVRRCGVVVTIDKLCDLCIAQLVPGADSGELVVEPVKGTVFAHLYMHDQHGAQLTGDQGKAVLTQVCRQHGQRFAGQIYAVGTRARFLVQWRAGVDQAGRVGHRDMQGPAVVGFRDREGVVHISGGFCVNGDKAEIGQVFTLSAKCLQLCRD